MNKHDVDTVSILKDTLHAKLHNVIEKGQKFSLLDFPDYDNIGDSAIYSGEIAFFDHYGARPSYVCTSSEKDWDAVKAGVGTNPILLQGGGNFGDIWPKFQQFREGILDRHKGQKVVQLPQTLHYKSQDAIDRTARAIEKHGAFTLFVRDQPSYELAKRNFQCDVQLSPDMAFAMGRLKGQAQPELELLLHLRVDQEAATTYDTSKLEDGKRVVRKDWQSIRRSVRRLLRAGTRVATALETVVNAPFDANAYRERYYRAISQQRVDRGPALLSSSRLVITDRLHGHIMCKLLDIPHCVIDNSYGKVGAFMDAWGTDQGNVYRARSIEEAVDLLTRNQGLDLAH